MKKNIILIACAALALVSCQQKSVLDPLEGIFTPPTVVESFSSASCEYEKVDGKRIFTLDLKDGSTSFHATLVGDSYCLTSNAYTEAQESAAKKGNYILGKTSVNGVQVESGTITITQTPIDEVNNSYTLKAVLFLTDGTPYKLSWAGNLSFEPEAAGITAYFEDVVTPMDDPAVSKHTLTFHDASSNDVTAVFELLLVTGNNEIAGTYTCAEYASAAGLMCNGYNFPDWGISGGSYIMKDGVRVDINAGETLTVTKSDGSYVFKGSSGYEFQAGVQLSKFGSLTDYSGWGMKMVGVELATEGVTVTPGDWGNTYGGTGNYLKLEFYSADGTIAAGEYKACAVGGTIGEGEFGIGYDGMFGASGTSWYTLADGVSSYEYVTDGTLKVEVDGDVYTIILQSSVVNAKYVGKLSAE